LTRLFHTTDLHASELVWRKTLSSASHYEADVVLLLGDLTGKAMVPFVRVGESEWYCAPYGKRETMLSKEQVQEKKAVFRNKGWYVFEARPSEVEELKTNPAKREELFLTLMRRTLDEMLSEIDETRFPPGVKMIVCPGNDDVFEIDDVILKHERVVYPLKRAVWLDSKRQLVSCEYVNPTPWNTPRECSEEKLEGRLEKEIERADGETDSLVCNFHAPPYDSGLDRAPKLDKDLKPVMDFGNPVFESVGSRAVLKVIREFQPLLGLHGHIHESPAHAKIGRTVCMNPGSEYQIGTISGYVIDLPDDPKEEVKYWRVTG